MTCPKFNSNGEMHKKGSPQDARKVGWPRGRKSSFLRLTVRGLSSIIVKETRKGEKSVSNRGEGRWGTKQVRGRDGMKKKEFKNISTFRGGKKWTLNKRKPVPTNSRETDIIPGNRLREVWINTSYKRKPNR